MVILRADSSALLEQDREKLLSVLPAVRRERASRIRHPLTQAESMVGGALVMLAFAEERETADRWIAVQELRERMNDISDWSQRVGWQTGEHGELFPQGVYLHNQSKRRFVSLSHSEGMVIAAADIRPMGVDMQKIMDFDAERIFRIASKFHPEERERLLDLETASLQEAFFRLWVQKESVLKLYGKGLSYPLSSFFVNEQGEGTIASMGFVTHTWQEKEYLFSIATWVNEC